VVVGVRALRSGAEEVNGDGGDGEEDGDGDEA